MPADIDWEKCEECGNEFDSADIGDDGLCDECHEALYED